MGFQKCIFIGTGSLYLSIKRTTATTAHHRGIVVAQFCNISDGSRLTQS